MDKRKQRGGSELRLLSAMDRRHYDALRGVSVEQSLKSRSVLFREGSSPTHLHVVLSGSVELYSTLGSKEATIAILGPGHAFILAAVVRNAATLMSARTLRRSDVLFVPAQSFRNAMQVDIGLALAVAEGVSTDFRQMVWQLRNQKLCTATQRLAAFLLEERRQQGGANGVALSMPNRALASLLGLEPESLSRIYGRLRSFGIEHRHKKIVISDASALEELLRESSRPARPRL